MDWMTLIPVIVSAASTIKSIIDVANSNEEIITKIKDAVPQLARLLGEYGSKLFPKVSPELQVAAAAMAAFDPNITKWIQGSLNALVDPSPALVVDGIYGPKTRAAVETVQAKLGLEVDGWAGQLTQAAIQAALAKGPTLGAKNGS